jgi:hypothetical protein
MSDVGHLYLTQADLQSTELDPQTQSHSFTLHKPHHSRSIILILPPRETLCRTQQVGRFVRRRPTRIRSGNNGAPNLILRLPLLDAGERVLQGDKKMLIITHIEIDPERIDR